MISLRNDKGTTMGVLHSESAGKPSQSEAPSWFHREKKFLTMLAVAFSAAGIFYDQPHIAMWIGFGIAAYSAIANDSIQTLGTFIAANKSTPWWVMWLFVGVIFLGTMGYNMIVLLCYFNDAGKMATCYSSP